MLDWLMAYLGSLQGVRNLAAGRRTGGVGTAVFAFSLGALHSLIASGNVLGAKEMLDEDARRLTQIKERSAAAHNLRSRSGPAAQDIAKWLEV